MVPCLNSLPQCWELTEISNLHSQEFDEASSPASRWKAGQLCAQGHQRDSSVLTYALQINHKSWQDYMHAFMA